jgi:glycosyltransferase involved in cell wall biosynthesis
MLYLNVGHTGLHNSALPGWLQANRVRAVYLIHDLIPLTHPEFCRTGEAAKHALRMQNALSSATAIIGNSRATLRELAAFARARGLPMPPNRAIWISGQRSLADVRAIRLGRPHFVTVGTIEGRKNHILLLRIWQNLIAEMKENAPALLILGQRGWAAEATWALLDNLAELKGHVRELGSCNDAELAGWVAGAQALLMPSFAEGFGLPIIEALQLGTPVVASDLDVYREIAGDIPAYVDPNDAAAWENAIRILLVDGWERERRKRAMHGYRPPDWPGHFAAVERWLRDL